jgi:hypothetical protein
VYRPISFLYFLTDKEIRLQVKKIILFIISKKYGFSAKLYYTAEDKAILLALVYILSSDNPNRLYVRISFYSCWCGQQWQRSNQFY